MVGQPSELDIDIVVACLCRFARGPDKSESRLVVDVDDLATFDETFTAGGGCQQPPVSKMVRSLRTSAEPQRALAIFRASGLADAHPVCTVMVWAAGAVTEKLTIQDEVIETPRSFPQVPVSAASSPSVVDVDLGILPDAALCQDANCSGESDPDRSDQKFAAGPRKYAGPVLGSARSAHWSLVEFPRGRGHC